MVQCYALQLFKGIEQGYQLIALPFRVSINQYKQTTYHDVANKERSERI